MNTHIKPIQNKVTVADIKRVTRLAGGTVEEDSAGRSFRVLQICAPYGKLWAGEDIKCIPLNWELGTTAQALSYNAAALADLQDSLKHGLRDMTDDERLDYDEPVGGSAE